MDKPIAFKLTIEVTVNSSDGTRQDAESHLEQMLVLHGLEGVHKASLTPVGVHIHHGNDFTLAVL